jgi:hypothetical protein
MNPEAIAKRLWSNAKANAKRRGVEFRLTLPWIIQAVENGECQATGLAFDVYTKHATRLRPLTPSLDRIKPSLGYTDENCRVIVTAFNVAKSDFGEAVFRSLAEGYLDRHRHSCVSGYPGSTQ